MEYREFGRTRFKVSRIGMGTYYDQSYVFVSSLPHNQRRAGQKIAVLRKGLSLLRQQGGRGEKIAALRKGLALGINLIDTAEVYQTEDIVAEAIVGHRRDTLFISTKVSWDHLRYNDVLKAADNSLKRLKCSYIDLYQVHWPNADLPLAPMYEALQSLQAAGKIRAIGVSNFGVSYLSELLRIGRVESNQLPYSLLWRALEYEVGPMCVENGIDILCYSPLCQGLLTGKFAKADAVPEKRARSRLFSSARPLARHGEAGCEADVFTAVDEIREIAAEIGQPMSTVAMAWLLHQAGVASVVAGARNAAQAAENALAADLELDNDVVRRLSRATQKVKSIVGKNVDAWEGTSRMERIDRPPA